MNQSEPLTCFVVDDDPIAAEVTSMMLETAGYAVTSRTDSSNIMGEIVSEVPDCVLIDLMMPGIDGMELCREIRKRRELDSTRIVIVSAKAYDFDKERAREFGANGYLTKPVDAETLVREVTRIIEDKIDMTFFGVRGTLPVPGPKSIRYGGNTSCMTLEFPEGQFFVFDAGSGIKALSDHLLAAGRIRIEGKIFISHPHWDHINALPFFAPLYMQGNEFEILGASHGDLTMRELISAQMDSVYFPITMREFAARVYFRDLKEEALNVDGIVIKTKLLNHPGQCLGYRVEYKHRSVCYVTDNELYLPDHPNYNRHYVDGLIQFVEGADILVTDTCYTDEDYPTKVGWGHSGLSQVIEVAHDAGVEALHLFHHDPDQSDDDIDAKLDAARNLLAQRNSRTTVLAPAEGDNFKI